MVPVSWPGLSRLVPAISVGKEAASLAEMAGTRPAMTREAQRSLTRRGMSLHDLDRRPALEAIAARERHDADCRPSADAALLAEHFGEEVGEAARHLVHLGEFGRADDEVERPHDALHAAKIAERLADAR